MKQRMVFFLMLIPLFGIAQINVDGIDINRVDHIKYVELVSTSKFFSNKVVISIDYGQAVRMGENQRIKDREGKNKVFNSVIDALNFMDNNGWEYMNSYVLTNKDSNEIHYLLRRKKE